MDSWTISVVAVRINIGFLVFLTLIWLYHRINSSVAEIRRAKNFTQLIPWILFALIICFGSVLRLFIAESNILDIGGISYSRLLEGYPGHFGVPELYSPVYYFSGRTIENGIILNRLAGCITIWAAGHVLFRITGSPAGAVFGSLAAAVFPLHILLSAGTLCTVAFILFSVLLIGCLVHLVRKPDLLSFFLSFQILVFMTEIRGEALFFLVFSIPLLIYTWLRFRKDRWYHAAGIISLSMLAIYISCSSASDRSHVEVIMNSFEILDKIILRFIRINITNDAVMPPIYPLAFLLSLFFIRLRYSLPIITFSIFVLLAQLKISDTPGSDLNNSGVLLYFSSFYFLLWFGAAWMLYMLYRQKSTIIKVCNGVMIFLFVSLPFIYYPLFNLQFANIEEHRFIKNFIGSQPDSCNYVYADHKHLTPGSEHTYEQGKQFTEVLKGIDPEGFFKRMVSTSDLLEEKPESLEMLDRWLSEKSCVFFYHGSICTVFDLYTYADCYEIWKRYMLKPASVTRIKKSLHSGLVNASDLSPEKQNPMIGFFEITKK
jgi:hypothetical protein